jgi:hypothetical protein
MTRRKLVSNNIKVSDECYSTSVSSLDRVRSFDKQTEVFNVLHSENACHNERLWFVGFLKFVGYSLDEICAIIAKDASWNDYEQKTTWLHVSSVFRSADRKHNGNSDVSLQFLKEGAAPENFLQKVFDSVHEYSPKLCQQENTKVACYFKKCGSCPLQVVA